MVRRQEQLQELNEAIEDCNGRVKLHGRLRPKFRVLEADPPRIERYGLFRRCPEVIGDITLRGISVATDRSHSGQLYAVGEDESGEVYGYQIRRRYEMDDIVHSIKSILE